MQWFRPSLAAVLLAGCGGYTVTPAPEGSTFPNRGDECGVRYEHVTYDQASTRYRYLGSVLLTHVSGDDHPDDLEKDVKREACRMGGEVITPFATGIGFLQFAVWRAG